MGGALAVYFGAQRLNRRADLDQALAQIAEQQARVHVEMVSSVRDERGAPTRGDLARCRHLPPLRRDLTCDNQGVCKRSRAARRLLNVPARGTREES
jgi:hypothetical protein